MRPTARRSMRSATRGDRERPARRRRERACPRRSLRSFRRAPARRAASSATNQRAMRSKRGHQNAQAPGRDSSAPKCRRADRQQLAARHRAGRRAGSVRTNRRAPCGSRCRDRRGRGRRRVVERPQLQDVARVDRVGIAPPGLDLRSPRAGAGAPRAAGAAPARGNGRDRAASMAVAPRLRIRVGAERILEPDRAQHRVEPQQPARRHGRRALDARGARQRHFGRAERLREIMRGDADRALGRRRCRSRAASAATSTGRVARRAGQVPSLRPPSTRDRPAAAALRRRPQIASRGCRP